jgi:hypothetical protein
MKSLRKVRWLAFALAALAFLQTPFVLPRAISQAGVDHRLILPFVMAFAMRVLFIGFLAKIWWDTRANAGNTDSFNPKPPS